MYRKTLSFDYSGGGYMWELKLYSPDIKIVDKNYDSPDFRTGAVGSGGTVTFILEAEKKGNFAVTAIYKRPWEEEIEKTKNIVVSFT